VTTALYRRYRPETFAEVIGQDHVTAPLRQALRSGQVNHAYLFSGPRGCGKTTSARILARILNCAANTEGSPTDTPCGTCESCVELARGGPGSLDVVEIDAASHGGVDDARELRERATFAPARDRFKIFILDEAHMVTTQGFNALLKIVEEPPPHVKFVFATTEPDKVIGTIRSRTHHYPFRLVPPDVLLPYLEELCQREGVPVGGGVLPLVVRAGGGSVRDTLSVLDQLIAGSGESGIDYEGAAALLGYTQGALLDDVVDAIAAGDGAAAFRVVERVIATGHEPRRFVEDLLERLRDLIVLDAAGEAAGAALRGLPEDQLAQMRVQAARLGAAELSRSADLANAALTEMTGATSPRLHLELLMARLLLPAADDTRAGLAARLDRLERGLPAVTSVAAPSASAAASPAASEGSDEPAVAPVRLGGGRGADAARAVLAAHRAAQRGEAAPAAPVPAVPSPTTASSTEWPAAAIPGGAASAAADAVAEPRPVAAAPVPDAPPAPAAGADEPADADERADVEPTDDVEPSAVEVGTPVTDEPDATADERGADEHDVDEPEADEPDADEPGEDEPGEEPGAAVADATPQQVGSQQVESRQVAAQQPDVEQDQAQQDQAPQGGAQVADEPEAQPFEAVRAPAVSETETLRRRWPEVLDTVRSLRRVTGALVDPNNAQVAELDATTLRLAFTTPELANTFRNGPHADVVSRAVHETLGFQVRVEAVTGDVRAAQAPARTQAAQRPAPQRAGRAPQSRAGGPQAVGDDDSEGHRSAPSGDRPAPTASAPSATPEGAGDGPTAAVHGSDDGPTATVDGTAERLAPAADAPAAASARPVPAADPQDDWVPPEEPDDPWATHVPDEPGVDPAPAAPTTPAASAAPRPAAPARLAAGGDVRGAEPAASAAPAQPRPAPTAPGVISPEEAAASWGLPATTPITPKASAVASTPAADRPAAAPAAGGPAQRSGAGQASSGPAGRGAAPAGAQRPTRDGDARPGGASGPGTRAMSAVESAVARAQRLAAAAPQRSTSAPRRTPSAPPSDPYFDASPDDPDMASSGLVGAPLVAQILGGTVIDEQVDDGR